MNHIRVNSRVDSKQLFMITTKTQTLEPACGRPQFDLESTLRIVSEFHLWSIYSICAEISSLYVFRYRQLLFVYFHEAPAFV